MIGSDFQPRVYPHKVRCSECDHVILAGETALVSVREGKVRKIVCGEDCRQEFDARFWAEAARKNARRIRAVRSG
jgi:hypothetical protein